MKRLIFSLTVLAMCLQASAQLSINTDGSQPASSAMLDVKSSTMGFLPPRMTLAQLIAIQNPSNGLMVFCTDCGTGNAGDLALFKNGAWWTLSSACLNPLAPVVGNHIPSENQIVWMWNSVPNADGYKWSTSNDYASASNVGASTSYTETGLNCNTTYTRYSWAYTACGNSTALTLIQSTTGTTVAAPLQATNVAQSNQINWNWTQVAGAYGYKWNSANNYATATDMGTATTKTEAGLTCNTSYTRYAWAYNACGNSTALTLTQSTAIEPLVPTAGTHAPSPTQIIWNWNTVSDATGYKWNTTNNFATATDMGTLTTKTENSLNCNTAYTRFVWAYNTCGNSTALALNQSTSGTTVTTPTQGTHVPLTNQITWNWNSVAGASGYKWNTTNNYATATDLGSATTKTETSLICNTAYTRYAWAYNACGNSTALTLTHSTAIAPSAPIAGTHVPSSTQIVWNWNTVAGANGYKWSSTNTYATATDMGTATTSTETGLSCFTGYTRYVWAYSSCGVSSATVLTQSTTGTLMTAPTAGAHLPSLSQIVWKWLPVAGATGYKWNTINELGTAINMGSDLSLAESGLNCNTAYTRYVWAFNECSTSTATTLAQNTLSTLVDPPIAGTHIPASSEIVWNWSVVSGATGYKWSATNNYASATDVGTATSKTESSLSCNTPYTRYAWAYNACGNSTALTLTQSTTITPSDPIAGTHLATSTQITWSWSTVAGATGYKWSTTDNYANATDLGLITSNTETGLTCNTAYTRFVWAYNSCGNSTALALNQSTSTCPYACGTVLNIDHVTANGVAPVNKTTTYETVANIPGEISKCWITKNLGATQQAMDVSDDTEASAGWYWQFNRKQGYKFDEATIPTWTITLIAELLDWQSSNDPCSLELGASWRIPTKAEWVNVDNAGTWTNWNGPWGSNLKLHAAGYLFNDNGYLNGRGTFGYYWSSTQGGPSSGWDLFFSSTNSSVYSNGHKAYGFPLRCLREN